MQENLKAKGEISSARENQVSSVAALLPGIYLQRCAHAKLCSNSRCRSSNLPFSSHNKLRASLHINKYGCTSLLMAARILSYGLNNSLIHQSLLMGISFPLHSLPSTLPPPSIGETPSWFLLPNRALPYAPSSGRGALG